MKTTTNSYGTPLSRAVTGRRISLLLCFLAGAAGALPYYFEELFILTFVSLFVQFYICIKQFKERKRVFAPFFCHFCGFYTLLYLFLSEMYPFERFGFSEKQAFFVLICACVVIPLLHSAVNATIMLLSHFFKSTWMQIIGYASLWVISEWGLSLGMLAFPWGCTAVSLTGFLPYLQTASLFGKYFITFVTVSGCYAIALSCAEHRKHLAVIGASIICINLIAGTVLWFIPIEKNEGVSVAAIQGNVLSNEKWQSGNAVLIFDRYIDMAEEAAKNGAKIILLPESAIPSRFSPDGQLHKALSEITYKYDVTVICGVHYYDKILEENYNSVIAVYPDGSLSRRYDKRHLVPFGEFIPFAGFIGKVVPFVGEFNEGTSVLTEGTEPIVIKTDYGTVTPLVCFDSIFPAFAQDGVNIGAEYIAVVTNDSWFNDSVGIYTHLRHSQLRAIENRRYVLRSANTGISAFIDERGNIISETKPLTVATATNIVYSISSKTLYSKVGNIILYISFLIILISIADHLRRKHHGNYSASSK